MGQSLPGAVRVVVVRGNGRAFSAGLDRAAFTPGGIPDTIGPDVPGGPDSAPRDRHMRGSLRGTWDEITGSGGAERLSG